jgi:hypothetical protein
MENNAPDFLSCIKAFMANTADVEKYDKLITQASKSAEKACRQQGPEFYSNKIQSLRIRTPIAHCHFNQLRKYNEYNIQGLETRLQQASTTIEFKDNPADAYKVYKDLKSELQEASKNSRDIREEELTSQIHDKHEKTHLNTSNVSRTSKRERLPDAHGGRQ